MELRRFLVASMLVIACFTANNAYSTDLTFDGVFYEQDAYIKNPNCGQGNNFCVKEILVNGNKVNADLNTGLITVEMSKLGLKMGDSFKMVIRHTDECEPEIINPKSFKTTSTFELVNAEIIVTDESSELRFTTKEETSPQPFYVEHFRNNQWMKVGVVMGEGGKTEKTYSMPFSSLVGENKIRIYQKNENGIKEREKETTVKSPKLVDVKIEKIVLKGQKEIRFTGVTEYFVVGLKTGVTNLTGVAKKVDISSLQKGKYLVAYDNFSKKFKIKK